MKVILAKKIELDQQALKNLQLTLMRHDQAELSSSTHFQKTAF